ncbi:hypothetical protein Pcinc_035158 [Petrolisthes cinctipes]|uniref:Uncharacterized protein n=1 Tax=Petrolisthes cinctipes TaxID=88211 RepID=A0AAE1BX23_PETCI|nr:hypothetical protein Pcinc_035158 [Petrolisthes cinctipes]
MLASLALSPRRQRGNNATFWANTIPHDSKILPTYNSSMDRCTTPEKKMNYPTGTTKLNLMPMTLASRRLSLVASTAKNPSRCGHRSATDNWKDTNPS